MRGKKTLAAGLTLLFLLLAGCGSGNNGKDSGAAAGNTASSADISSGWDIGFGGEAAPMEPSADEQGTDSSVYQNAGAKLVRPGGVQHPDGAVRPDGPGPGPSGVGVPGDILKPPLCAEGATGMPVPAAGGSTSSECRQSGTATFSIAPGHWAISRRAARAARTWGSGTMTLRPG